MSGARSHLRYGGPLCVKREGSRRAFWRTPLVLFQSSQTATNRSGHESQKRRPVKAGLPTPTDRRESSWRTFWRTDRARPCACGREGAERCACDGCPGARRHAAHRRGSATPLASARKKCATCHSKSHPRSANKCKRRGAVRSTMRNLPSKKDELALLDTAPNSLKLLASIHL
jgi:hypothetical protein